MLKQTLLEEQVVVEQDNVEEQEDDDVYCCTCYVQPDPEAGLGDYDAIAEELGLQRKEKKCCVCVEYGKYTFKRACMEWIEGIVLCVCVVACMSIVIYAMS
jgi:hypothetical protein